MLRNSPRIAGNVLVASLLAFGSLSASGHEVTFKDLQIQHPYTIEPVERLPKELPLYMVIRNNGDRADRLIAIESGHATSGSLVARASAGGVPQTVTAIELPANAETVLGPGTAYVLLRDLKEPLEGYEYFPVTMTFEIAGKVEVEIFVEDRN